MAGWQQVQQIGPKNWRCGFCGYNVGNDRGYFHGAKQRFRIWICPTCDKPTFFEEGAGYTPSPVPGNEVRALPKALEALYREARQCCSVSAYTASVLACRKMLMNIAV